MKMKVGWPRQGVYFMNIQNVGFSKEQDQILGIDAPSRRLREGVTDLRMDERTDEQTDGRTDGRTDPLIEMRRRI